MARMEMVLLLLAGYGFGLSTTQAGLVMLPSASVMLLAGPASGWLGGRSEIH